MDYNPKNLNSTYSFPRTGGGDSEGITVFLIPMFAKEAPVGEITDFSVRWSVMPAINEWLFSCYGEENVYFPGNVLLLRDFYEDRELFSAVVDIWDKFDERVVVPKWLRQSARNLKSDELLEDNLYVVPYAVSYATDREEFTEHEMIYGEWAGIQKEMDDATYAKFVHMSHGVEMTPVLGRFHAVTLEALPSMLFSFYDVWTRDDMLRMFTPSKGTADVSKIDDRSADNDGRPDAQNGLCGGER